MLRLHGLELRSSGCDREQHQKQKSQWQTQLHSVASSVKCTSCGVVRVPHKARVLAIRNVNDVLNKIAEVKDNLKPKEILPSKSVP